MDEYSEWSVLCSAPIGRMIVLLRGVETPQTEYQHCAFLSLNKEKPAQGLLPLRKPAGIPVIAGQARLCSRACLEDYAA